MTRRLFDHLPELKREIGDALPIWLGTDFDGTLTHHQDDPATVELPAAMRARLAALAAHPRFAVGLISGRSLVDLMARVALNTVAYSGNHGIEIETPGFRWVDPAAEQLRGALAEFAELAGKFLGDVPGARLENKKLSLSVDYRPCSQSQKNAIVERLDIAVARFPTLRLRHAPLGSEVLPRTGSSKGTAVQMLRSLRPAGPGIYLGDDLTDEDAFRAMPHDITIHVGERETAARFRVESADRVAEFFDWLIRL